MMHINSMRDIITYRAVWQNQVTADEVVIHQILSSLQQQSNCALYALHPWDAPGLNTRQTVRMISAYLAWMKTDPGALDLTRRVQRVWVPGLRWTEAASESCQGKWSREDVEALKLTSQGFAEAASMTLQLAPQGTPSHIVPGRMNPVHVGRKYMIKTKCYTPKGGNVHPMFDLARYCEQVQSLAHHVDHFDRTTLIVKDDYVYRALTLEIETMKRYWEFLLQQAKTTVTLGQPW
jgi:hypothetical protein